MSRILLASAILLTLGTAGCDRRIDAIKPTRDPNQPDQIYVPKDMNDCFAELERMLHPKFIQKLKEGSEQELAQHHFGLGLWMRNYWGLWSGSRLQKYFADLGFTQPDDMSGVIITCFWRHLHGLPTGFNEMAERARYYNKVSRKPTDWTCPEHHVPLNPAYELGGETTNEGKSLPRWVRVARCSQSLEIWVYEYDQGWYKPGGRLRERIEELEAEGSRNLSFAPIEKPVPK